LEKLDFELVGIEVFQDNSLMREGKHYRLTKERHSSSGVHIYYYD
jgi:hypothetical protein